MALVLNRLLLRIATADGIYGIDLEFTTGLNIIRAENSSGKSQCMTALIYALGLEGVLTTSRHQAPFAHALTQYIERPDGTSVTVLESEVILEFTANETVYSAKRAIKCENDHRRNLIQLYDGRIDGSLRTEARPRHLFVRRDGAAQREAGFHYFLAKALGWELPRVLTYDGRLVPLYVETLFPFLFVAQKSGWQGTQRRFPTSYRIRDVDRRAFEFLLNLDTWQKAELRQAAKLEEDELNREWVDLVRSASEVSRSVGASPVNLPKGPVALWPPEPAPELIFSFVEDGTDARELNADVYRDELQDRLQVASANSDRTTESRAPELEAELRELERKLSEAGRIVGVERQDLELAEQNARAIEARLKSLEEDKERHIDDRALERMGAALDLSAPTGHCPTCSQSMPNSLHAHAQDGARPMTLDENIDFIKEQLELFRSLERKSRDYLSVRRSRVSSLLDYAAQLRQEIRSKKQALRADGRIPSKADLRRVVELEHRLDAVASAQEDFRDLLEQLGQVSSRWNSLQLRLEELQGAALSPSDIRKLDYLGDILRHLVRQFGFASVDPREVSVSRDTYRPEHDGFALDFDVSASDMIRLIWAYLLGILRAAVHFDTAHPRLLILDEPKQQSAKEESFAALLYESQNITEAVQVIVATSEEINSFDEKIRTLNAKVHRFSRDVDKLLQPFTAPE